MDIAYPEAEDLALPFAGHEKLSVYSGDFEVTAEVRVPKSAAIGTQRVHGQVRYQACDNRQCFPPKTTSLEFDVKVVRPKVTKNPPSPPPARTSTERPVRAATIDHPGNPFARAVAQSVNGCASCATIAQFVTSASNNDCLRSQSLTSRRCLSAPALC